MTSISGIGPSPGPEVRLLDFARRAVLVLCVCGLARDARTQEPMREASEPGVTTAPLVVGDPGQTAPTTEAARPGAEGGRPGGMGGPGGGAPGYEAVWYPLTRVSNQASDFGLVRQSLRIGAPIWRGGDHKLMANFGVRNSLIATDAVLPDSLRAFPDELWNVTFGLNYIRQFGDGRTFGLMAGFGSASDRPFDSVDEVTANVSAFLRVPARNGRDAWQFMLMYMYGGALDFPIPMVSYAWNPSETLRVNIGLPFTLAWRPSELWTFDFSYFPLNNVNARGNYRIAPDVNLYAGYEFLNESYFLADRDVRDDRFFGFEQRVFGGWRWEFAKYAALDANAGFSFGRRYGEGDSQWGSLRDRLDVDAGPFLGGALRLRF